MDFLLLKILYLSKIKSYLHKKLRIGSSDSPKLQIYGGWYPPSATRCLVCSQEVFFKLGPLETNLSPKCVCYVNFILAPVDAKILPFFCR